MKKLILAAIAVFTFAFSAYAQPSGGIWSGSRSATGGAKASLEAIISIYEAFLKGENDKGWAVYSEDVALIDPSGKASFGKKTNREEFEASMKMMDEPPKMAFSNMEARLITNNVAIVVWDANDEFKMGGQTISSKSKCSAVLRKVKGEWKMEFAQLTPMSDMPAPDADNKH